MSHALFTLLCQLGSNMYAPAPLLLRIDFGQTVRASSSALLCGCELLQQTLIARAHLANQRVLG